MANKYQVIGALSTFTPALSPKLLTLSAALSNIQVSSIESIVYSAYAAGTDGTATITAPTAVVGTSYTLAISYQVGAFGQKQIWQTTQVATVTTASSLATLFAGSDAGLTLPFAITSSSATITITNTPTSITGYYTGETIIHNISFTASDGTSVTPSAGTTNVYPVGNPNVIIRDYTGTATGAWGTVSTSATYDVCAFTITPSYGVPSDVYYVYVDLGLTDANGKSYIQSGLKCIQGVLGLGAGAAWELTATATSATTTAIAPSISVGGGTIVPFNVTSSATTKYISIPAGLPIGTTYKVATGATAPILQMPSGEALLAGTAAGTSQLPTTVANMHTFVKVSSTNWHGFTIRNDGTATTASLMLLLASS